MVVCAPLTLLGRSKMAVAHGHHRAKR
jgi:hypothetical protein